MRKVLILAHAFPPFRSVGHSIRVVKFIKYLPFFGWLPVVLTIDDRKEYWGYRKEGSECLLAEVPPAVAIYRTAAGELSLDYLEREARFGERNWLTRTFVEVLSGARRWGLRNFALPDQSVVWLPYALRQGRRVVRDERIDVILATCPPHSAALAGAWLKRLTGKPLILDFRDDWIDTPWHESKSRMVRLIERNMERWAVKTADKVILVTEWSRKAFLNRYPDQRREKFAFISNGFDSEEFAGLSSMAMAPRDSRFTILHAGSLCDSKSWLRTPVSLFQAVRDILRQRPELENELTLAFTNFLPEGQKRLVQDMGLSRVVRELGFLPRDEFLRRLKESDLLLTVNYMGFSTLIPGKIYEYWAVGGPPILLLSCPGAATSFVEQHGLGLAVDPHDVLGIRDAVLAVYRQSKAGVPRRVRTDGLEAFDRRVLSKRLADVMRAVTVRGRPAQS